MKIKRISYYILISIVNLLGLILLGISFLSGPASLKEAEIANRSIIYRIDPVIRLGLYVIIITLLFSLTGYLLSFFFRKSIGIERKKLRQVFIKEFIFFILSFVLILIGVHINMTIVCNRNL